MSLHDAGCILADLFFCPLADVLMFMGVMNGLKVLKEG